MKSSETRDDGSYEKKFLATWHCSNAVLHCSNVGKSHFGITL